MLSFVVRRVISTIPVLFVVSFLVYGMTLLIPGDAATTIAGGVNSSPERIEEVRRQLHLDDPFLVQYGRWLKDAVQLDLGRSLLSDKPVASVGFSKLPATLSIVGGAISFGAIVGGAIGVAAGTRVGTRLDRGLMLGATTGLAVPNFWLAMILVSLFGVKLGWFPVIGYTPFTESPRGWLQSVTLPSISLGVYVAASIARQVRGELADVMQQPYIRTAFAKGLSPFRVVGKHALKNALIPAVTVLGLQTAALIGGTVIVESIFSIPGMGSYLLEAVFRSDIPVIMGVTTLFVLIYLVLSIFLDAFYSFINPKVRPS